MNSYFQTRMVTYTLTQICIFVSLGLIQTEVGTLS